MKKTLSILIVVFLVCLTLGGCGNTKESYDYATGEIDDFDYGYANSEESKAENSASANDKTSDYKQTADASSRKLIRDASLSVETEKYDEFSALVESQVSSLGGYIESSSEDSPYYSVYRNKSLTLRIPAEKLDEFLTAVSEGANVTSKSIQVKDITGSYIDTQSRIKALETEMDALLEILSKADTVTDLIEVQDRITQVNAELESCKTKLKTYDDQIAYSTVRMSVSEVKRETSGEQEGAFAEIRRRLSDNLFSIAQGLRSFFISFISSIPYLLITALIIVVFVLIVKKLRKKAKKRREAKRNVISQQSDGADK